MNDLEQDLLIAQAEINQLREENRLLQVEVEFWENMANEFNTLLTVQCAQTHNAACLKNNIKIREGARKWEYHK